MDLLHFDRQAIRGFSSLWGIDEAGRGAFAGPVAAAVVGLTDCFYRSAWCRRHYTEVNDSKLLRADERTRVFGELGKLRDASLLISGIGLATVEEIEEHNVLGATRLAMCRALENAIGSVTETMMSPRLQPGGDVHGQESNRLAGAHKDQVRGIRILVDGRPLRPFPYQHEGVVKGDRRSLAIAMASVVAKVTRDRVMRELHERFPRYGFADHKGYGTVTHRSVLLRLGPTPCHRPTFLRKLFAAR